MERNSAATAYNIHMGKVSSVINLSCFNGLGLPPLVFDMRLYCEIWISFVEFKMELVSDEK